MVKYRIIKENNKWFIPQYRRWWHGWEPLKVCVPGFSPKDGRIAMCNTIQEAKEIIENTKKQWAKPTRVVIMEYA